MRSKPGSAKSIQAVGSEGHDNIRSPLELLRAESERTVIREQTKFWLIWGSLLAFGLALAVPTWDTWPSLAGRPILPRFFQNLFWKSGEAILIAQVLALLVDQATKKRLLGEFAKEVSTHIIGRRLPTGLRKYIEQYLETDLIRTNWTITYTITEWPGESEYVQLVTLSVYEMANRSNFEQPFKCRFDIEKSFFPQIGEAKILHVTGTNLLNANDSFDYPKQKDLKLEKDGSTGSNIVFSKSVMIPIHDKDQAAYRFSMESRECFHYGSIDPFFSYYPVLSTTLTVFYPVESMKVDVDLSFGDIETDVEYIQHSNGSEWVFKKPMLSGQGFSVRFSKLPPKPAATVVPAAPPAASAAPPAASASPPVVPAAPPVVPAAPPVVPASPPVVPASDKV